MLMLICYERKTLMNGWLILVDKFKRIGRVLFGLTLAKRTGVPDNPELCFTSLGPV
jgi:hypothetical protein